MTNTLDIQSIRGRLAALIASEKAGDAEEATRLQSVIEAHYASDVAELLDQLDAKNTEIATKDTQIAERDATIARQDAASVRMTETLKWYAEELPYQGSIATKALYDRGKRARQCLQSLKEPNT